MRPMPEELMAAHTIKKVNPSPVDIFNPDVKKEWEYPELAFYD
jgi:hypothetical protein